MITPDSIDKVRKQDFKRYVDVQRGGRFNMITQADAAARLAGLKMPRYLGVIENYAALANKWPDVLR